MPLAWRGVHRLKPVDERQKSCIQGNQDNWVPRRRRQKVKGGVKTYPEHPNPFWNQPPGMAKIPQPVCHTRQRGPEILCVYSQETVVNCRKPVDKPMKAPGWHVGLTECHYLHQTLPRAQPKPHQTPTDIFAPIYVCTTSPQELRGRLHRGRTLLGATNPWRLTPLELTLKRGLV